MRSNFKTIWSILLIVFIAGIAISLKNSSLTIPYFNTNKPVAPTTPETPTSDSLTGFTVPDGFKLSIFAEGLPGARVMQFIPEGILVSQTSEGKISLIRTEGESNGKVETLISGLNKPHGLAFQCAPHNKIGEPQCYLYVAEQGSLSRFPYNNGPIMGKKEFLIPFNSSSLDRHFTRSLLFLPPPNDNILLISFGSSCNVCHEKETEYASIMSYNINTKEEKLYAKGLRNAVFMTLNPQNNKVYATEMGRDNLGDNLPPDEINIIEESKNYGWPNCYGKNIHDDEFDHNTYIRNPCMEPFETPSFIGLPAHSAPLGLTFIPSFPETSPWLKWQGDLLVAYHGSWNRSEPTGYKVVRIDLDSNGNYVKTEDFITGWTADKKLGRPVDINFIANATDPNSALYISDDTRGVIYKLSKD